MIEIIGVIPLPAAIAIIELSIFLYMNFPSGFETFIKSPAFRLRFA